jgi:predicted unusual protein kinase regulating ubiquinone biosynthesis (AarF/ABC1/UbiB family)
MSAMRKSRYRRTMRFFTGVLLREIWWDFLLPRIGLGVLSRRTRAARMRRTAARFRGLAVRMGGVLIKVGQFLSSRLDVLPREITAELAGLQDEVGAERFDAIRAVIEDQFGARLEERFVEFDPVPLASASIGQVHRARLCANGPDGAPCPGVVVKVQRPHIQDIVEADLAAIRAAGAWLAGVKAVRRHMDVPALIEEFSKSLYEEIDYIREGHNAETFARNFKGRSDVVVPGVIWSHTTLRVLTLEDVGAVKITDYQGIEAAGISRPEVARRLLDVYLKQVFEDGFFHADPHPGNLFVAPAPRRQWKLVFIDFGMTGTLDAQTFGGMKEVLLAVGTRDPARLVRAFRALRLLLPEADLELLERACKKVFDTLWGKSTREIMKMSNDEFRSFADEFGDLLYEMPFQVPENLILLGRCVSILSGIATGLDPDFSVWQGLAPYVQKFIERDGSTGVRLFFREVTSIARSVLGLPRRVDELAARIEQGRLDVRVPEMRQQIGRLERAMRKLGGAMVFAAGVIAASILVSAGHFLPALGLGAAGLLLLLWILLGR